jgi:hypothetical protein
MWAEVYQADHRSVKGHVTSLRASQGTFGAGVRHLRALSFTSLRGYAMVSIEERIDRAAARWTRAMVSQLRSLPLRRDSAWHVNSSRLTLDYPGFARIRGGARPCPTQPSAIGPQQQQRLVSGVGGGMKGLGEHGRAARGHRTDPREHGQSAVAEKRRDDGDLRFALLGLGATAPSRTSAAVSRLGTSVT